MGKYTKLNYEIDDKELQRALKDPNAKIFYNFDGTYNIEYIEPDEQEDEYKKKGVNYSRQMSEIYQELVEFCRQQGLPFLNKGSEANFEYFIADNIPNFDLD